MIFNNILLENTYNLDFVENLSNFILSKYLQKEVKKLEKTNITKFIPKNLNPKNYKILFYYKTSPKNVEFTAEPFYYEDDEGDDILDGFKIVYVDGQPFNKYSKEQIEQFKETLKHEITHILDYIRADGKTTNIDMEKSATNQLTYFSDPGELNAMINVVRNYKQKNPIVYNSIKTYKSLLQNIATIGQSRHETVSKEVLNNKELKKKILKRLAREKLLPSSYLDY